MSDIADISLERAKRAVDDCAAWNPRDALVEMLADIDSGKVDPWAMVIAFVEKTDDGGNSTGFRNACPDIITAQGVMSRVAWRLNDPEG